MNSKNLLTQLSDLEASLNNFSFEELTSGEATRLQKSFQKFKAQLEGKVWGEPQVPQTVTTNPGNIPPQAVTGSRDDLRTMAAACHQMRTPLAGIIGLADMLDDNSLSEEQKHLVRSLHDAGQNLMNMVVEVTEFSRLLAGLEHFEELTFNFHNLIEDVEYLCRTLIVDKRPELKVTLDQAIPKKLTGDPSKLSQVLLHLLGIFVKREFDGKLSFDVQFQHKEDDKVFLEFSISNEGSSRRVYSGESVPLVGPSVGAAYQKGGITGLGLPIVNQIVQKLGGEMYIQDTAGLNFTYAFRLPFTVARETGRPEAQETAQATLIGLKVLIVEGNPLNQQVLARRCKSWGCIPYITDNTLDAERMLDDTIGLLLIDFSLQGPEEIALVKKIRNHKSPQISKLPVIGVVGNAKAYSPESLTGSGLDDFLVKPYGAEELQLKMIQYGKLNLRHEKLPSVLNDSRGVKLKKKPIDLEPVLQDCMGRIETLEELVTLFKQKNLEFIGAVKLHLDRSDFSGIEYACQKVGSSLKLLRADSLLGLVDLINKGCGGNRDITQLKFLHHCFTEEYPHVEQAVDKALKSLKGKQ